MAFDRRRFLQATGLAGTMAVLGQSLSGCSPAVDYIGVGSEYLPSHVPAGSILNLPAKEAPIDHIVILMMENRSFDHYFGWLSRDVGYIERGVSNYGPTFRIDAQSHQQYVDPEGTIVSTFHLPSDDMPDPWRGCGFNDPGHGWRAGMAQRDHGFLSEDSGNDRFALGYFDGDDLPFLSRFARRFTTFDRYHCAALTSTQTNRRYLHSGWSGGHNTNYIPIRELGFKFDTIWDRLRAAQVDVRSYYADLPSLAFWGERLSDMWYPIEGYFDDCRAGRLPAVTFLDPPYLPWWQADDHPHADPRAGQRFLRDVFRAFAQSPHWERGLFILTYDEWGGFYDHVRPPMLPDHLAGPDEFGYDHAQAGFRVPTVMASPYAKPGYVDHRTYDHTSIMRFLEWRFLGAPPEGPGVGAASWSLALRDRYANNIDASLGEEDPVYDMFDLDDLTLPAPLSGDCSSTYYGGYIGAPASTTTTTTTTTTTLPTPATSKRRESQSLSSESVTHGPAADLVEAFELGFFDQIGHAYAPSDVAGVWIAGDEVTSPS